MTEILVCVGGSCHLRDSYGVLRRFTDLVDAWGLHDQVRIGASPCLGSCAQGVCVSAGGILHRQVAPADVEALLGQILSGDEGRKAP